MTVACLTEVGNVASFLQLTEPKHETLVAWEQIHQRLSRLAPEPCSRACPSRGRRSQIAGCAMEQGQSEVEDLDLTTPCQHQIGWFEVPVCQILLVGMLHPRQHPDADVDHEASRRSWSNVGSVRVIPNGSQIRCAAQRDSAASWATNLSSLGLLDDHRVRSRQLVKPPLSFENVSDSLIVEFDWLAEVGGWPEFA